MVIFHSYVSLPEGKPPSIPQKIGYNQRRDFQQFLSLSPPHSLVEKSTPKTRVLSMGIRQKQVTKKHSTIKFFIDLLIFINI